MIVAAIFGDAPPAFPRPRKRPFLNEHSQHGAAGMGRLDVEIVVADQGDYPSLAENPCWPNIRLTSTRWPADI